MLRGVRELEGRVRGENIVVWGTEEDSKEHEDTLGYSLNVYLHPQHPPNSDAEILMPSVRVFRVRPTGGEYVTRMEPS